jgi:NDP-sugar pyrophosphorylase family protein
MRALVLTAGLGTRLRPLTYVRAKAAVPVNGDPLVRRIVRWLAAQDFRDLVLNLHHEPESIARVMGDGGDADVRIRYSWEQPVLGSAGGPRHALPLLADGGADTFLLVNGDTLTELDLGPVIEAHHASGALVTMAVVPNPRPEKYGGVLVARDGTVTGFTGSAPGVESHHFIGIQVASVHAFAGLPDGEPAESVGMLYPRLLRERSGSIRAYICDAEFHDIGTPADYLATCLAFAESEGDRLIADGGRIDASARVVRTTLWDDVTVGPDVRLTECIACDGVRVPPGASFTRAALVRADARRPRPDERVDGELLIRTF